MTKEHPGKVAGTGDSKGTGASIARPLADQRAAAPANDASRSAGEDHVVTKLKSEGASPVLDEIDDRYSVRGIARSDTAGNDRPGELPRPAGEITTWVAEANGELIGSISMVCAGEEAGRLEQFHVASEWEADRRLARRLVRTAADFAREQGVLKLVIDVPDDLPGLPHDNGLSPEARAAEAESRVRVYFEMLGFVFSRRREAEGHTMIEFYLNLYKPPLIEPSASH